jgi:acyl dehydratase
MGISEEPPEVYFKFVADLPPGNYSHPVLGEVSPGATYKVRIIDAAALKGDPNWEHVDRPVYAANLKEQN